MVPTEKARNARQGTGDGVDYDAGREGRTDKEGVASLTDQ